MHFIPDETGANSKKKIKATKESILRDEIVNKDIEESAGKVQNSDGEDKVVKEMNKRIIKINKCSILWLTYQQGKVTKRFKTNDNFVNM